MRSWPLVDPAYGAGRGGAGADVRVGRPRRWQRVQPAVAVEFSTPASVFENARLLLRAGVHTVVGATGLTAAQVAELARDRAGPASPTCWWRPTSAVGAVLLMRFAREAARYYERAEIIELHHEGKLDAPSGTALRTASLS